MSDILANCRQYPKDEAPAAYNNSDAMLDPVKVAGLASEIARLKARFVIKDADMSLRQENAGVFKYEQTNAATA